MAFLTKCRPILILQPFRAFLLLLGLLLLAPHLALSQIPSTTDIPISEAEVPEPYALVTFYSHSFGENFPHAFVIIEPAEGEPEAFGFSARSLSPGILLGSVRGEMKTPGPRYIRQSKPQFSVPLNAEQLTALLSVRDRWEAPAKPKYNLDKRNCVHFVGELAEAIGLDTNDDSEHFKSPGKYLREVAALNPGLVERLSDD